MREILIKIVSPSAKTKPDFNCNSRNDFLFLILQFYCRGCSFYKKETISVQRMLKRFFLVSLLYPFL